MGHNAGMGRRIALIVGWVLATFATGLVAWGAVRLAGTQVSTQAVRPLSASEVAALPEPEPAPVPTVTVAPTTAPPPTSAPPPVVTTAPPESTVSSQPTAPPETTPTTEATPTTIPPPPSSTSTTTTSTTTTTTTTTAPPETEVRTYHSAGGSVTIVVGPGTVELGGATPASGYTAEVKKAGPDQVEVEFESISEGPDFKFKAEWENGVLEAEFETEDD